MGEMLQILIHRLGGLLLEHELIEAVCRTDVMGQD